MSSQTGALIVVYQTMFWKSKHECEASCNNVYEWSILFDFFCTVCTKASMGGIDLKSSNWSTFLPMCSKKQMCRTKVFFLLVSMVIISWDVNLLHCIKKLKNKDNKALISDFYYKIHQVKHMRIDINWQLINLKPWQKILWKPYNP